MRLITHISLRLAALTTAVVALWAVLFYFAIIEEVNDETDDALEDYAETIIRRWLTGEELPSESNGSNNQYFMRDVTADYAATHPHVAYEDRDIYILDKHEKEPARVLTYIFRDHSGDYHEIEVSMPNIEKEDLQHTIFFWMLLLGLALLAGIVLTNVFSVYSSMKPLRRLLAWIDRFQLDSDNPPLQNSTRITEFRQLNESVAASFSRNQQQYEQQKRFIGNASHELQTPIAASMNRLELLLDDGTLSERQATDIAKTIRSLRAMSKLNSSLLTLTKIENGQYGGVPVAFRPLVGDVLPDMQAVYAARHISVATQWKADFTPVIDENLARLLVTNLLKNAFVHNVDGGRVVVSGSDREWKVANTGRPQPLDAERIFEPFYHSASQSSSTGLGLALVRAVCRQYHLQVSYQYQHEMHVFTVSPAQAGNS